MPSGESDDWKLSELLVEESRPGGVNIMKHVLMQKKKLSRGQRGRGRTLVFGGDWLYFSLGGGCENDDDSKMPLPKGSKA